MAALVTAAREELDVAGLAYVVVHGGDVVAIGGSGVSDEASGEPVDPAETIFRIGSVSKPLTALSVLLAEDVGLVDLDAAVGDYVDVDLGGASPVTVGSLLTHTAGFEANSIGLVAESPDEVEPLGDYLAAHVPSRFEETGIVHSYSNYGYALAGHVVEQVTDTEFADQLAAALLEPLGMTSTTARPVRPDGLATGYDGVAGARFEAVDVHLRPYPAGGVTTTAADMGEVLLAMLGHRPDVVPVSVVDRLGETGFRAHPDVPGRTVAGLEELTVDGHRVLAHNGDIAGFGAQLALVPEEDLGIFFAANAVDFELNDRLVREIIGLLLDPVPAADAPFVDLPEDALAALAGSYRWTRHSRTQVDKVLAILPTSNFEVTAPGDGTIVVAIGGVEERWTYRPIADLAFAQVDGDPVVVDGIVVDPGERIAFSPAGDGEIAYLTFSLATITGERTPAALMGPAQLLVIMAVLGVLLLGLVVWGGAALRRRRRPVSSDGSERLLRRAVPSVTGLVLLGLGAAIGGLLGPVPFGLPPLAVVGIAIVTIASLASLLLVPATVVAWQRDLLSVTERVTLTALALAAPVLVWWLSYWNLFGLPR